MSANTLLTSVVTGGTNNHTTTSEEANAIATDFVTAGTVGTITLNTGSGGTGSFCVNADASPDMGVTIKAGQAYVSATPSSQNAQVLRVRASADYTTYVINANATGSTRYDWIYLSVSATNANTPSSDASNVASFVTSRSTSNTVDNGAPPTYGLLLAIVTVANGASSITNGNITDKRVSTVIGGANSSLTNFISAGTFDYVASGLVWSADSAGSTLAGSMTAGTVYIGGAPNTVSALSGHSFTASKDTYVDILYSSTGVGTVVFTEVSNNAASPALASNSIRIAIVVTGGSSIATAASINQGQENRVLPIASSVAYTVTDSLGNLICPRDPSRKILGYRQITSNVTGTTIQQVTGLSCPVIVPTGRKIIVSGHVGTFTNSTSGQVISQTLWDGVVNSGTQIAQDNSGQATGVQNQGSNASIIVTPSATSKTYNMGAASTSGTFTVNASATSPAFIMVRLA